MTSKKTRKSFAAAKLTLSVAVALAAMGATSAYAFKIDTGNPDGMLQWDTTLRYNAGWRLESVNDHFARASGTDESETVFKKNDMMLSRLDLYTEADYIYRGQDFKYGARVSASAWSENAYPSTSKTNPDIYNAVIPAFIPGIGGTTLQTPSNYGGGQNGKYSDYTKRFLTGSSGEINDAFVFGSMMLGSTNLDVKLGQHNIYWGESFVLAQHSVAHMQGPTDSVKGLMSPGIDAKEAYMPLNRISTVWSLTDTLALLGEYTLDWKPGRGASGGTYFSSSDVTGAAFARAMPWYAASIKLLDPITPGDDGGDWGIGLRWSPWFDKNSGSMGFYYRKYDEKTQWPGTQINMLGANGASCGNPTCETANIGIRFIYPRDTELYAITYSTRIGTVSTGMEISYRKNAALSSTNGAAALQFTPGGLGGFTPSYAALEGPRGNTFHALVNGIYLLPSNPYIETGNLLVELGYARLLSVTKNPNLHNGIGYAGCAAGLGKWDGCATKDALTATVRFNPQWFGVLPSVDLTLPIGVTSQVFGNNPTNGTADYEGLYSWSIGATVVYKTVYEFGLQVADRYQHYKTKTASVAGSDGIPSATVYGTANGPLADQNNHRWVNLRFKTTF